MSSSVFLSQDKVLAELLQSCKEQIVCYHEHESLLDHKQEEELSEAECKAAWAEYEAEVKSCTPAERSYLQLQSTRCCGCLIILYS